MKLLFLDVDGVLNDHRVWPNRFAPILPEPVTHLNQILAAVPDLEIVFSSAWRYRFETPYVVEALLCVHGVNAFERVHGVTRFDPVPAEREPYDNVEWWSAMGIRWRGQQIQDYVRAIGTPRFAVLDDLPLSVDNLFRTEQTVGLTAEIASAVIRHFQPQTMLERGVEGHWFHPHPENAECASKGCKPLPDGWGSRWDGSYGPVPTPDPAEPKPQPTVAEQCERCPACNGPITNCATCGQQVPFALGVFVRIDPEERRAICCSSECADTWVQRERDETTDLPA